MNHRDTIVIGASGGGVTALSGLCRSLPPDLPASVFVVLHIGARSSNLPRILSSSGPLQATHAQDGEVPLPARIYIAPPDHHMLLEQGQVRLSRGPKENHTRPAIDPLFRSAALNRDGRVIGIVLSGYLDDGTAGLRAIKRCGGIAMAQDPQEAEADSMPLSALANVEIDHCAGVGVLAHQLGRLARQAITPQATPAPADLLTEHLTSTGEGSMAEKLQDIGSPSTIVCPECKGVLWELHDQKPVRFRCHTGHGYTLKSLVHEQVITTEAAIWNSVRALQDLEQAMRKLSTDSQAKGDAAAAHRAAMEAEKAREQAGRIEQLIESGMGSGDAPLG
jgi:two-component system, chemotaxis family, protein-glutamate methylesterase/glutaminase